MGRTFLQYIGFATLYLGASWQGWEIIAYGSEISWPSPPASNAPTQLDEPLLQRPETRRRRPNPDKPAVPKSAEEIQREKLTEQKDQPSTAQKVVPIDQSQTVSYSTLLNLGFHYPWMRTTGSKRREYEVEPSTHAELLFNTAEGTADHWQPWWGFGMNSLQGRGIYEKVPGRFGYLLVGPRIGFIKMHSRSENQSSNTASADGKKAGSSVETFHARQQTLQSMQLFSLGLNLRISTNRRETSLKSKDNEDFNSKAVFDKPGISARYYYHWFYADGFALGPGLGFALLNGKNTCWLELGVSLFL